MRLDRWLVEAGLGARREVQGAIRAGLVSVAGTTVWDPGAAVAPEAPIVVDGVAHARSTRAVWLVHKPADVVTSTDTHDGVPVTALLPASIRRLRWMPVGRLDKDVTGLVLLTTDGELAHRLTHPRWRVGKTYEATLLHPATEDDAASFARGLVLRGSGEELRSAELSWSDDARRVTLVLHEGRYHQIKRMFGARGNEVVALRRVAHGPLGLPADLPLGAARPASPDEEALLRAAVAS